MQTLSINSKLISKRAFFDERLKTFDLLGLNRMSSVSKEKHWHEPFVKFSVYELRIFLILSKH